MKRFYESIIHCFYFFKILYSWKISTDFFRNIVNTYSSNRMLNDLQLYHRMSQFSEVGNHRVDGPNYVSNMQQAYKRNSEYFIIPMCV